MSWTTLILATVFCLALEAFFSGAELAIVSADKLKLTHRAASGHRGSRMAVALANRPEWFFSATLLGQNLFIVANSILVTFFVFNEFGMKYEFLGLILAPFILIFGEAVPKSLAQQWADRMAPVVSPFIIVFSYLFYPVVWPLSRLTLLLMGGVQGSLLSGHTVTRESLELLLRESEAPRELSPVFKQSLLKTLVFSKKQAHEIMTPLIQVFSLRENTGVEEAITLCREEGYSSVPVFQRRAFNVVGVVNFFNLLLAKDLKETVGSLMETPYYVPEQMGVREIFLEFRDRGRDFAVVVDEYGGAVGVVTMEDIAEEVVGEIEDEYDEAKVTWKQVGPSQYLFQGKARVDEINDKFRWGIPRGNYETLAGFLVTNLGRFPESGDVAHFGNLTMLAKTVTSRSVEEIMVEIEP